MALNLLKHVISSVYGDIQALRERLYAKGCFTARKLPCKVVCVGNLTAGGTGKTPMIMYLAELLQRHAISVVIVSRGYRGALEQSGGLVSDREQVLRSAAEAGDEPYLLACRLQGVPVYVGRNRYASGLKAMAAFKPDVILLDDGFQHLQLQRDFNLLLMDAEKPLDNGYVIPRGLLREKPKALNRAQAIVFTRGQDGQNSYGMVAPYVENCEALPHFVCGHQACCYLVEARTDLAQAFMREPASPAAVFGDSKPKVFVFSGLAKNQSFHSSVTHAGLSVVGSRFFPDHYAYTPADLAALQKAALAAGANFLVTTEKDHAKLQGRLDLPLAVFGVKIDFFGRKKDFDSYFLKALDLPPSSL